MTGLVRGRFVEVCSFLSTMWFSASHSSLHARWQCCHSRSPALAMALAFLSRPRLSEAHLELHKADCLKPLAVLTWPPQCWEIQSCISLADFLKTSFLLAPNKLQASFLCSCSKRTPARKTALASEGLLGSRFSYAPHVTPKYRTSFTSWAKLLKPLHFAN